ncbi:bifunctional DNA primase/polymerase [Pinisolibacter aquiterrae]|uniref:bifunctional DNA primase/polymerase n=1 Tax=Pinisolibacter aquiterrae TaxID=2815579 RepID=UPI001C3E5DE8|nr:bifunctional DNA primase/polymerase [Pinisolibacter aquiterrae]
MTAAAHHVAPAVAATIYAAAGLRIFPCDPASKRPLISDWPNAATADAAQVAAWWATWPNALIGCALKGSRVLVLDGDNHREEVAGAESGVDFLWRNLAHYGVAPTAWAATAGAGVHVPMWLPEGVTHGNSSPWRAGYIDVRGPGSGADGGGYVILPGSIRADGARWSVAGRRSPVSVRGTPSGGTRACWRPARG